MVFAPSSRILTNCYLPIIRALCVLEIKVFTDNQKLLITIFLQSIIPLLGLCAYGAWIIDTHSSMYLGSSAAGEVFYQQVQSGNVTIPEIAQRLKIISQAELEMGVNTKGFIYSYYALGVSAIGIAALQVKLVKSVLKTHNKSLKQDK